MDVLALGAVATLPFTAALTLDVSFPLKLYELALVGALAVVLAELRLETAPGARRAAAAIAGFLALAAGVLALRLWRPLDSFDGFAPALRFGPAGDGLAKLCYLALALFAFLVLARAAYRDERSFLRCWLIGALAAAWYSWLLIVTSVLEAPAPLLPGIERPQLIQVAGVELIRSGTFEEGNFLGLYLVCSVAVAWYARRVVPALFLSATVLVTFSTANVVGLVLFWAGVGLSHAFGQRGAVRRAVAVAALAAAGAGLVAVLVASGYATNFVIEKLTTEEYGSKLDRLETAAAGLLMFADHPLFGVGIGQYNYHYGTYQLTSLFAAQRGGLSIANNVYVELLSETGIVGLGLFALFQRRVFRGLRGRRLAPLRWGGLAILLVFNAFPSYVLIFLWAYWALLLAASLRAAAPAAEPPA